MYETFQPAFQVARYFRFLDGLLRGRNAQAQRACVSAKQGATDNAACSRSQPCRTFNAAVAAVTPGGEVVVLSSGGYAPVTITKAVQIVAPAGVHASISQTSGNAVTVAAGVSDVVTLRGLTLNGSGGIGVNFDTGAALHVSNTVATDNVIGFGQNNGAVFESYGNNRVRGNNASDTAGVITPVGEI